MFLYNLRGKIKQPSLILYGEVHLQDQLIRYIILVCGLNPLFFLKYVYQIQGLVLLGNCLREEIYVRKIMLL